MIFGKINIDRGTRKIMLIYLFILPGVQPFRNWLQITLVKCLFYDSRFDFFLDSLRFMMTYRHSLPNNHRRYQRHSHTIKAMITDIPSNLIMMSLKQSSAQTWQFHWQGSIHHNWSLMWIGSLGDLWVMFALHQELSRWVPQPEQ